MIHRPTSLSLIAALALTACGQNSEPEASAAASASGDALAAAESAAETSAETAAETTAETAAETAADSEMRDDAVQPSFDAPSGQYVADAGHRYITFTYSHLGFSNPFVRWRDWDATLDWNAEDPEASSVSVTIDATSVDTGVDNFDDHLRGERFFDVANYPEITFVSTGIERTGEFSGKITGDLTVKGITKPVVLDATFNNGGFQQRGNLYKIGFSAKANVLRTDFGVGAFAPNVGDEVEIIIEVEFDMPAEE